MTKIFPVIGLIMAVLVAGCGGGGSGGGPTNTVANPTKATLKISAAGALALGTALSGVGVTVTLPKGVFLKTDTNGNVQPGVIVPSGVAAVNSSYVALYTPETGLSGAKVDVTVASTAPQGFGAGEFVTVTADIATGASPKAADFSVDNLKAANLLIQPVTVLAPAFTVEFL